MSGCQLHRSNTWNLALLDFMLLQICSLAIVKIQPTAEPLQQYVSCIQYNVCILQDITCPLDGLIVAFSPAHLSFVS